MNKERSVDTINELKSYLKELKSYDRLLRRKDTPSINQKRYIESLRERLVRKSGALTGLITKLTGKKRYTQLGNVHDIWSAALMRSGYLPTKLTSLSFCIDAVTEAIGKLENYINHCLGNGYGEIVNNITLIDGAERPVDITSEVNNLFDKMKLHQKIIEVSEALFKDGHYAPAI